MNNFFDDRKAKVETYHKNYRGKKDPVSRLLFLMVFLSNAIIVKKSF